MRLPVCVFAVAAAMVFTPGSAVANAGTRSTPAQNPSQLAERLSERLGQRTAGSYLDARTGELIVTVTDDAGARTVRAAGATPEVVARSGADLAKAEAALPRVAGTAWSVDPVTDQVRVLIDESVKGADLERMTSAASRLGGAVRVERRPGELSTRISGGDAIHTDAGRCSLGFNVHDSAGTGLFVTAGHCTNVGSSWWADSGHGQFLGSRTASVFPGRDYGLVRYGSGISHPGNVNLYNGSYHPIVRATTPVIRKQVWRSGSTSGLHTGTVVGLDATVNYPEGTVTGLIQTTVCAEPGDSGGPLFSSGVAHGVTSGGIGNCAIGGITYFQPIVPVLDQYGLTLN